MNAATKTARPDVWEVAKALPGVVLVGGVALGLLWTMVREESAVAVLPILTPAAQPAVAEPQLPRLVIYLVDSRDQADDAAAREAAKALINEASGTPLRSFNYAVLQAGTREDGLEARQAILALISENEGERIVQVIDLRAP